MVIYQRKEKTHSSTSLEANFGQMTNCRLTLSHSVLKGKSVAFFPSLCSLLAGRSTSVIAGISAAILTHEVFLRKQITNSRAVKLKETKSLPWEIILALG